MNHKNAQMHWPLPPGMTIQPQLKKRQASEWFCASMLSLEGCLPADGGGQEM